MSTSFKTLSDVVADDFTAVDRFIIAQLRSDVGLIDQVSRYIVDGGGKRLRPLVALLSARAAGYQGNKHINIAAIIEMLHTATLLHDDVIDESLLRRGRATVNAVWGNAASVLVGDFLISRAFQLIVAIDDIRLMNIMANGTCVISEGEVLQLMNCRDPDTSEERYFEVIYRKTAKMFEAAAETSAALAGNGHEEAFAAYARHLGIAFQLIDDVLDYDSSAETLGKNVGDDLAEGKPTLPLIEAMRRGSEEEREVIRSAIKNGGLDNLPAILDIVKNTRALEYTRLRADEESAKAIAALKDIPDSCYRDALIQLAHLAVYRDY